MTIFSFRGSSLLNAGGRVNRRDWLPPLLRDGGCLSRFCLLVGIGSGSAGAYSRPRGANIRAGTTPVLYSALIQTAKGACVHNSVIGTGYVGLVTGACFVQIDLRVTCMGTDSRRISRLTQSRPR
ncbi:MAG: hypothetical protein ACREI9_08515 [Nitrospiraceae bacterium]